MPTVSPAWLNGFLTAAVWACPLFFTLNLKSVFVFMLLVFLTPCRQSIPLTATAHRHKLHRMLGLIISAGGSVVSILPGDQEQIKASGWEIWRRSAFPPQYMSRLESPSSRKTIIRRKKVNIAHTRLPSVGFQSWSRFLAVSLQVTWVINPAIGCYYFPPGLQLPPRPLRGLLPILLLVNRGTMGVKCLPKIVTRQRRDCDLNPGPSAPESSTLTTRLPSHPDFSL